VGRAAVGLDRTARRVEIRENAAPRVDEAGQSETLLDWREGEMPRWMNCLVSVSGVVERDARVGHGYGACGQDYWMREEVKDAVSRAID
jgi:hypothetical protein